MSLLDGSWPWWLGALALSVTTVLFLLLLKVPMGVSGSYARAVDWRRDRDQRKREAPFLDDREALMANVWENDSCVLYLLLAVFALLWTYSVVDAYLKGRRLDQRENGDATR